MNEYIMRQVLALVIGIAGIVGAAKSIGLIPTVCVIMIVWSNNISMEK